MSSIEYPQIPGVEFDPDIPAIDMSQIEGLLMADDDEDETAMIRDIYALFCEESLEKLDTLGAICAAGDSLGVRKVVHFIAGSAGNLGISRLAAFYRAVEKGIDDESLVDVSNCEAPIREAFAIGCKKFEAALDRPR